MKRKSTKRPASCDADEAARLYIAGSVVGTWMEPALPDGSQNLFRAGVVGRHSGRIVCVGRFGDSGPLESRAIGILTVTNPEGEWSKQGLRLDFLNRASQSILLTDACHRIISEWVTVLDANHRPVRTGGFNPPLEADMPQFEEWLTMPKEWIVRNAANFPTPPEVFAKFPELYAQNPVLYQIVMTNFCAFRRWVYSQPATLEKLRVAGRRVSIPGGSPLPQMVATEWVNRGDVFKEWYEQIIEPLCPTSPAGMC